MLEKSIVKLIIGVDQEAKHGQLNMANHMHTLPCITKMEVREGCMPVLRGYESFKSLVFERPPSISKSIVMFALGLPRLPSRS